MCTLTFFFNFQKCSVTNNENIVFSNTGIKLLTQSMLHYKHRPLADGFFFSEGLSDEC